MFLKSLQVNDFRSLGVMECSSDSLVSVIRESSFVTMKSVLDAVAVLLTPFVKTLCGYQNPPCPLDFSDRHRVSNDVNCSDCWILIEGLFELPDGGVAFHSCERMNKKGHATYTKTSPLMKWARAITKAAANGGPADYPLIAYYGSDTKLKPRRSTCSGLPRRIDGYDDALDPHLNYRLNIAWILQQELIARQKNHETTPFQLLRKALQGVVHGCQDIYYDMDMEQVRVTFINGANYPLTWLPGSTRDLIIFVADMVRRIIIMNPHMGLAALEKTSGIVLVDHLSPFMGPASQYNLGKRLAATFPKIQFLVVVAKDGDHSDEVKNEQDSDA